MFTKMKNTLKLTAFVAAAVALVFAAVVWVDFYRAIGDYMAAHSGRLIASLVGMGVVVLSAVTWGLYAVGAWLGTLVLRMKRLTFKVELRG